MLPATDPRMVGPHGVIDLMKEESYKILENAALGESMCATLLMERFWVLQRSVDIDGGDFFIQLRDSSVKFTDFLPPRIGTVQSKFSQDPQTVHYLKKEYVVDLQGTPLPGFFLIIHMGKGSEMRRFLLTSTEIAEHLPMSTKNGKPHYTVGATAYAKAFEAKTNEAALDKIEIMLKERSEADRLKFLKSVTIPDYDFKRSDVDNTWMLPIPNEHAYIADEIYHVKCSLRTALYAYDKVQNLIGELLLTTDPQECVRLIKELRQSHEICETDSGYYLHPYSQELRLNDTLDKSVNTYKLRYKMLKQTGYLSPFIDLLNKLSKACSARFANMEPIKREVGKNAYTFDPITCSIGIKIDITSKTVLNFVVVEDKSKSLTSTYDIIEEGKIFTNWEDGKLGGWRDMHRLIDKMMGKYFKALFPEETVGEVKQVRLMMV